MAKNFEGEGHIMEKDFDMTVTTRDIETSDKVPEKISRCY